MDLEKFGGIAGNGGLTKPSDFIKNILICVVGRVAPAVRKFILKLERKVHTSGLVTTS